MLNEQKFEVGDKVYCVTNSNSTYKLSLEKIYTIKVIHYDDSKYRYFILEESPFRYLPERFENEFYYRRKKLEKIIERMYNKRKNLCWTKESLK